MGNNHDPPRGCRDRAQQASSSRILGTRGLVSVFFLSKVLPCSSRKGVIDFSKENISFMIVNYLLLLTYHLLLLVQKQLEWLASFYFY